MTKKEVIEIEKRKAKAAFLSMALIDAYKYVSGGVPLAVDLSEEKRNKGDIDPIISKCGLLLVGVEELFDFHIAPVLDGEGDEDRDDED